MDNAEEIMQSLEEFSKMKPKDIPHELDDYLGYVAKTGDPVFKWSIIKCLFREKLVNVITDFYESTLSIELPPCPNVDPFNYERMKANLLEKLDSFHGAPFTVQRISELLTNPRKEYNRADKFMRAIEKNILVVSTREPGRIPEGECENDPSYNGMPDTNEPGVDAAFPCNDLSDPDSSSQSYEVTTETIEPAYKVTVDTVSESEESSIVSVGGGFLVDEELYKVIAEPSTSGETKDADVDKESDGVICSNAATSSQEQVEVVEPALDTPIEDAPSTDVETTDVVETPIPSTSEATPAEASLDQIAEPGPSTSHVDTEPEQMPLEEATSSTQSQDAEPSIEQIPPSAPEVETTTSQEASPAEEPVADTSNSDRNGDETEVPVSTSDSEVELRCQEAVSFEHERLKEDTSEVHQDAVPEPEQSVQPKTLIAEPSVEPQEVKENMDTDPADGGGDLPVPEENEVTPSADSSSESKPEVADVTEDKSRENTIIHSTSQDESMEVDECQTTSSEESQP